MKILTKEKILEIAKRENKIKTAEIAGDFGVSRQYAHSLISKLVKDHNLIKVGSRRKVFYVTPEYAKEHQGIFPSHISKVVLNKKLEEHVVLDDIEKQFTPLNNLPENVRSIFNFAFSEMLNNAIEHSRSEKIEIKVSVEQKQFLFQIVDHGIGVFKNIQQSRNLHSELEAIQDLLKGKTTTQPRSHSGEGIFFTSKISDVFKLESYGYELIVDNTIPDVFILKPKTKKFNGTKVTCFVSKETKRHLNDVFEKYANIDEKSDYGFDRTEIKIKLYTMGGVFISRSQARRILSSLDKFRSIVLDFDKVPTVGQAFADEIFRVFQNKHPDIEIIPINMKEPVEFMVKRARKNI